MSDEVIYETILASYTMAKEQQARLRKWRSDEVTAFAQYFKDNNPEDYAEFIRQERKFNEIEAGLAWGVINLISEWMPELDEADADELFGEFRDHAR